jgi:tRNA dimethylallyltransferase
VNEPVLIVVAGPTGSGKSDLAISLAEAFNGEIVNCDSVQLYRYMDIGTAKTPVSERRDIPHHLIDILNPDEVFTAGDYQRAARSVLTEITARGRVPVVVGGTGFYLRALISGLFQGPGRDDSLRARLSARKPASLHRLLTRLDATTARRIHVNDRQKLIRALEVCLLSRAPVSSLYTKSEEPLRGFRIVRLGLDPPREELTRRIHERCERMFQSGLVDEVKRILAMGFPAEAKALESIGYRESLLHIRGELTFSQAVLATQVATRQYAKRQRTWFRRETGFHWLHAFGNQRQTFEEAKRLVISFQRIQE